MSGVKKRWDEDFPKEHFKKKRGWQSKKNFSPPSGIFLEKSKSPKKFLFVVVDSYTIWLSVGENQPKTLHCGYHCNSFVFLWAVFKQQLSKFSSRNFLWLNLQISRQHICSFTYACICMHINIYTMDYMQTRSENWTYTDAIVRHQQAVYPSLGCRRYARLQCPGRAPLFGFWFFSCGWNPFAAVRLLIPQNMDLSPESTKLTREKQVQCLGCQRGARWREVFGVDVLSWLCILKIFFLKDKSIRPVFSFGTTPIQQNPPRSWLKKLRENCQGKSLSTRR